MAQFLHSKRRHAPIEYRVIEKIAGKHGCWYVRSRRYPPISCWFEGPDLPEPAASEREASILVDLSTAKIPYPLHQS